jgi:oligopeptide transport system ATP-binding protein
MPWTKPRALKAVDGVSFDLYAGETLGIVGESGCGKSTLARAVIKMVPAEAGKVMWLGKDLISASKREMQAARRDLQMIFQDPLASLNPRMTIGDIIAEPLKTHHPEMKADQRKLKVKEMLIKVGLLPNQINRYPHEFSGGQCQRIGIARALILEPKLIICDEPVSALDVSIQAQIVNLLMELQKEMGLSLIFIAHDLSIVQHISTRVMVLYLGNVCEITTSEQLYATPRHPYTQALISAVPVPDPEIERKKKVIILDGDLPSPMNPPSGCVFRTRCPKAQDICAQQKPELIDVAELHEVACHFHD